MAVSYVNRKCESCGSRKFQYNEKSKTWTCLYCGNTTEREEKYDGLFTIKNVVRQTLLDISYRRLESAEKNLIECEKIDSKYIGTIIATICFLMIRATAPGEAGQQDIKNIILKIKKYNDNLQLGHSIITDDEEMLYEFFEDSNIYATLLLVFVSINDKKRSENIEKYLKICDVDSKDTNENLLRYSLKNQRFNIFDKVIENGNIDENYALTEVLSSYPDNDQKLINANLLMIKGDSQQEKKTAIESYLSESADKVETKSKIFISAVTAGININTEAVIKSILENSVDIEIAKNVFTGICSFKLTDEDVERIIYFCFNSNNVYISVAGLNALKESSQYVVLEQKHVVAMYTREDISAGDKVTILIKAYEFNLEVKHKEAIINNYLCFNQDKLEDRKTILPFLLGSVNTIPTNTFENYILRINIDGPYKIEVIKNIMKLDINISFFHGLLAKYIFCAVDSIDVREQVINILIESGVNIDPKSFSEYVCTSEDENSVKIKIIKILQGKGCTFNDDILNNYLIGMKSINNFSSELFTLLIDDAQIVSDEAVKNYLLYCVDNKGISKLKNIEVISNMLSTPLGASLCSINHLGNTIDCNLLQAYILLSNDSFDMAYEIVKKMISKKVKINSEIRNKTKGTNEKLKKYVLSNRDKLSSVTDRLCEAYKVYSMLF